MTRTRGKRKAPVLKPPTLFVIVYVDTDGTTRTADSCVHRANAEHVLVAWRRSDSAGRKYRIVRYIPAPTKPRARTAKSALKNFDKTFGSLPEFRKHPSVVPAVARGRKR